MGQPSWKYEKRSVGHCHNDLIGVLGGQFRRRLPDQPRLIPRIVKIDGVCARMRLYVVNAAQEIVWVTVNVVRGAWRTDVGPARSNFERTVSNLQVIQQVRCDLVDAGNQFPKFVDSMQGLAGLPSLSGLELGQGASHSGEPIEDIIVYSLRYLTFEARLPNERRKETQSIRRIEL